MYDIKAKPRWLVQAHADLQRHEGFREFAYPDPLSPMGRMNYKEAGFISGRELMQKYGWKEADGAPWTVGYGFTQGVTPDSIITKELADQKLYTVIYEHLSVLDNLIPSWIVLPMFAQTVLISLAFNLGYNRLRLFAPTLEKFKEEKWQEAARRLENTAWYKQTGTRARELVCRLKREQIQPKYLVPDFSGVSVSVDTTARKV